MNFTFILKFLQQLSTNNNRDWFEKNKPSYLKAKGNFDEFLVKLLAEMVKWDRSLSGLDAKKLAFRIYRDVRFAKDKRPYKNNMGAGFSARGKMMMAEPGYYIHIEPRNKSLVGVGLYGPEAGDLAKIRQEIDYNPEGLLAVLNDKKFKKLFPELDDFDQMKNAPPGYAKDHPHLDLLKRRSFIVSHFFTDQEVKNKKFIKQLSAILKTAKPLNDFLKEAIS